MNRTLIGAIVVLAAACAPAAPPAADDATAAPAPAADVRGEHAPHRHDAHPADPGRHDHGEHAEDAMSCEAEKAEWMIGQAPTDELLERGRIDAGAQIARYIRHDEMVTMEYHPSRLNVDLDENGLIHAVRCG